MQYNKVIGTTAAALVFGVASIAFAFSPNDYSLFGSAHYISPGNASARAVQLVSDNTAPGYGGIDYGLSGSYTFADIKHLSTDYKFDAGSCGGGSPRFQINLTDPVSGASGNIFVYIGPPPSYTGCPMNVWTNSGELLGALPIDTSQLPAGNFYDPYSTALAKYGGYTVTGIQLVADAGWAFPNGQIVDIDNTTINSTLYTYEVPIATSKDQCKDGGWQNLADNNGHGFKNQGDCVSFVATKGKNQGSK